MSQRPYCQLKVRCVRLITTPMQQSAALTGNIAVYFWNRHSHGNSYGRSANLEFRFSFLVTDLEVISCLVHMVLQYPGQLMLNMAISPIMTYVCSKRLSTGYSIVSPGVKLLSTCDLMGLCHYTKTNNTVYWHDAMPSDVTELAGTCWWRGTPNDTNNIRKIILGYITYFWEW